MEKPDPSHNSSRVRKQNSQLQDEPSYRFDEKGYKVPVEHAAPSVTAAPKQKKPPQAPKKTVEAPVPAPAAADPIPIAERELSPPDGTVATKKKPNEQKWYEIHWTDERDELLLWKTLISSLCSSTFLDRFGHPTSMH